MAHLCALLLLVAAAPLTNGRYYRPNVPMARRCSVGRQYQCGGMGQCIPQPNLCGSAVSSCRVGVCNSGYTGGRVCRPATHYQCGSGNCLPRSTLCNGFNDCGDMSDELRCYGGGTHLSGGFGTSQISQMSYNAHLPQMPHIPAQIFCNQNVEYTCYLPTYNGYNNGLQPRVVEKCINSAYKCNGFVDCSDGSDEQNCPVRMTVNNCQSHDSHRCRNGECVTKAGRTSVTCDRRRDCQDGSDEDGCTSFD